MGLSENPLLNLFVQTSVNYAGNAPELRVDKHEAHAKHPPLVAVALRHSSLILLEIRELVLRQYEAGIHWFPHQTLVGIASHPVNFETFIQNKARKGSATSNSGVRGVSQPFKCKRVNETNVLSHPCFISNTESCQKEDQIIHLYPVRIPPQVLATLLYG